MFDSFAEMRARNAARLVHLVRENGQISRAELARLSGLSKATVSSIIEDLLATDLLQETGSIPINKGRFPTGLVFNPRARCIIGLMLEDDRIGSICAVDCAGQLIEETPLKANRRGGSESIYDVLKRHGYKKSSLLAIGIAVPGPIAPSKEIVIAELSKQLRKEFGRHPHVESVVNCGAIAETFGRPEQAAVSLFVRSGETVRSTLIVNGSIITKRADYGGDLGHTSLGGRTEVCECGNRGCVNALASEAAIISRLDKRERAKAKGLREVVELCKRGNKAAADSVGVAGQAIGQAIGSMLNVLAPANVVVCGELVDAGSIFWEPLLRGVKRQTLRQNLACSTLLSSSKGPHAPALGAALLALQNADLLGSVS